jgi:WD40 repeat protein/serine/threonine protein kinase
MNDAENRADDESLGIDGIPTAENNCAVPGPGGHIGPYKLLRILGEGGYGIVYLAEQQRPVKRRVALKVIKPGMDTKQVIARFEAERQALALLDHPNIAHVFNAGTTEAGRPYFAMEYVKGDPITEHCDRYKLTIEERLKLFMTVCEAVQYAHQKAIIHRDIKPSNILVAYEGEKSVPMIIDFGVAKALSQSLTERTLVTEQAQMVGTPEYMSPEQAEMTGQDIDTRTDVYSLGALLYELLTGTLPFDPKTLREAGIEGMRRMIREQYPKTPSVRLSTIEKEKSLSLAQQRRTDVRTLGRHLQGELDWITLKAMDKDRTRRYQTAYALAEDIQRYLNQEPVLAGPPSTIYKFRKFAARNKGMFISVATITVVVVLAAIISFVLAITTTKAKMAETEQRQKAETLARQQEEDLYFNHIKLAHQELKANRPVHALNLLAKCPEHLRNWEWHYLQRKSHFQETPPLEFGANVFSFDFSPDGSKLAVFCADGRLVVRDWTTEQESSYQVRNNIDQLHRDSETIFCQWVDFCPDGKHIAVIGDDYTVNLISIVSGERVQSFIGHTDKVKWIDCSPDGNLLATASYDNTVRLWDRWSADALRRLQPSPKIEELAFSNDGKQLIVYILDNHLETYDVKELLSEATAPHATKPFKSPAYGGIAISRDGRRLAIALWDNTVLISDGEYNELMRLRGHVDFACTLAFNSDGTRLVSTSVDRTIRLWDTVTGREVLVLGRFDPFNRIIAFSKNDHELIVGDCSKRLRVFDASPLAQTQITDSMVLEGQAGAIYAVNYSPSGDQLVSSGTDSGIRLWSTSGGRQISTVGMLKSSYNAQFSSDGKWIASVGVQDDRYIVKVWEAKPPHQEHFSEKFEWEPSGITFSIDSKYLLIAGDGKFHIYNQHSNTFVGTLGEQDPYNTDIIASPDGKYMASTGFYGTVKIWDATRLHKPQEGRLVYKKGPSFFWIGFSPDSKRLAVCGKDGDIDILDVESGEVFLTIPKAHGDKVSRVSFGPNGRYLASCSADQTVRIWDAEIGRPIDIFLEHKAPVLSVAFSPDGKHVASAGYDGTIRIWTPRLE